MNPITLDNLIVEPSAYRNRGRTEKALFYFTESHNRLVQDGYERHTSFQEQISLLILHLENKLTGHLEQLNAVAEDMLKSYGEWCNQAYKTIQQGKTRTLTFIEGVTRLDWDKDEYRHIRNTLEHSVPKPVTFDVSDLSVGYFHFYQDIYKKHGDLIKYTHTKKFKDLPEIMKETAEIFLPLSGHIWPFARSGFGIFCVDASYYDRASRGVRRVLPRSGEPKN